LISVQKYRSIFTQGGRSVYLKSAIVLSTITSDCPASNGEQAIATAGRQ